MADLMNTKQVAVYLGINEKKIYAMAKAGAIPCTRVTGKWLFPKKLIDHWLEQSAAPPRRKGDRDERLFLLAAGSDDPSLGVVRDLYAARSSASLYIATVGSSAGLTALEDGVADFALAHLMDPETGEYNLPFIKRLPRSEVVVASLFHREVGLLVAPGNPKRLTSLSDMTRNGVRIVNRQEGSGTRRYFDQELARLSLSNTQIAGYEDTVATHMEVGLGVLRTKVDAGIATKTVAQMLGLDFVPLMRERFDLLVPRERFFSRGIQLLLNIIGSGEFRGRVESMGGYDVSESGRMIAAS